MGGNSEGFKTSFFWKMLRILKSEGFQGNFVNKSVGVWKDFARISFYIINVYKIGGIYHFFRFGGVKL